MAFSYIISINFELLVETVACFVVVDVLIVSLVFLLFYLVTCLRLAVGKASCLKIFEPKDIRLNTF